MPNNHPLVMSYIESNAWAITQDGFDLVHGIATRTNELTPEALQKIEAAKHEQARAYVRDEVGIVPISGPIFNKANMFTQMSGATSTQTLALDFTKLVQDDSIKAIILEVDSPGGVAAGIAEMSELVYEARKVKPIYAYVSHMAASAAYWVASAADRVILAPTAAVGSIGAILQVQKGKDDNYVTFTSAQSPFKNASPTSKEGKAQLQAYVDSLAQVFISDVARNRDVKTEDVLSKFRQGGIAFGQDAVAAGMADSIQTFEKFFAKLTQTLATHSSASVSLVLDEPEPNVLDETGEPEMSVQTTEPTIQPVAQAASSMTEAEVKKLIDAQAATLRISMFENELNGKVQDGSLLPAQKDQLSAAAKTMLEAAPTDETLASLRGLASSFKDTNILSEQVGTPQGTATAPASSPKASTEDIPDNMQGDSVVMDRMAKALVAEGKAKSYKDACLAVEKSEEYQNAVAAL